MQYLSVGMSGTCVNHIKCVPQHIAYARILKRERSMGIRMAWIDLCICANVYVGGLHMTPRAT